MTKQKAVRVNVCVPADVRRQMITVSGVNWSMVFTNAVKKVLQAAIPAQERSIKADCRE